MLQDLRGRKEWRVAGRAENSKNDVRDPGG